MQRAEGRGQSPRREHTVAVLAPSVYVSITVEEASDGNDDIHLHAGGQGIWIARMLRHLGERPVVCAPVGGEAGEALRGLLQQWDIELHGGTITMPTASYVHDRRSGERTEIARSRDPILDRHETDELYHRTLELALAAGTCVVTGPEHPEMLSSDFYRRLAADLATCGVRAVGDLHGDPLDAFLDGGPLAALKVSAGDLRQDGLLDREDGAEAQAISAMDGLAERGVDLVVLSRAAQPLIARFPDGSFRVTGPLLETVDTTGSGDSMTAGIASAVVDGLDREALLRRAWAAGAANVTRHGLGSANPGLIDELADRVSVERLEDE